jgi:integrase
MGKTKINFTDDRLRKIQPVKQKRIYLYDTKTPGLRLQITPAGALTFQFQVHDPRKRQAVTRTLGRYPKVSISKARELAGIEAGKVASGIDIEKEAQAQRQEWTLDELFDYWLENHAKPHKKSWHEDERRYNLYIKKPLGKKKLSQITTDRIRKLHLDITKMPKQRGLGSISKTTANRALVLLSTVFNQAVPNLPNPCRGVKTFKEVSRDRWLQPDELKRFFSALYDNQTPSNLRAYILLSLFTGARRSNLLSMRWSELDMKQRVWNIPAHKSKNGEKITIPLVEQAIGILKARKKTSVFVFPSRSVSGHLEEPKTAWYSLRSRAGLEDVRLHDLRRSMGSYQTVTGASTAIVGKTLGHKNQASTAVYQRLNLDPVRASMEKAVAAMLATKDMPGKVVDMITDNK